MAIRIREDGTLLCAAHTDKEVGDTYLDDYVHYYLSVLTDSIRPSKTHDIDNLWFWNITEDSLEHYAEIKSYEEGFRGKEKTTIKAK